MKDFVTIAKDCEKAYSDKLQNVRFIGNHFRLYDCGRLH